MKKLFILGIIFFIFTGCSGVTQEKLTIDKTIYTDSVNLQVVVANLSQWAYKINLLSGFEELPINLSNGYKPATDPVAIPIVDIYGCRRGCPYAPPLNCSYSYPATKMSEDIKSYLVKFYVTAFTPTTTILNWNAEVKYNDGSISSVSIVEDGDNRDSNILTGTVLLKEKRYYNSTADFNTLTSEISFDMDSKLIKSIKYSIVYWNQDKATIIIDVTNGFFNHWNNHFKITINKSYFSNSYLLGYKISGIWNDNLLSWERIVKGVDWEDKESIIYDSSLGTWFWAKSGLSSNSTSFTKNKLRIISNDIQGEYSVCITDTDENNCNVILKKNGKVTLLSSYYSGEGECNLNLLSGSCNFSISDLSGKYKAFFNEMLKEDNSFSYYYTRDLSLTGNNPDETGKGNILSESVLWGNWKKIWENNLSLYNFLIYYPTILVNDKKIDY